MSTSNVSVAGPSNQGKRRRSNVTKACVNCRRRKSRCDGVHPVCRTCQVYQDECSWAEEDDGRKPASRQYVNSLKNRIKLLEASIKEKGQNIPSPGIEEQDYEDDELDDQEVDKVGESMLHLHMGDAGEEVHFHGPTSAYAHSSAAHQFSTSPTQHKLDEITKSSDFRRYLPKGLDISYAQHTIVLDRFFRFFASWGMRASPDLFHQDMIRTVTLPARIPTPRFSYYSPFLHNIILSIALMWSDDDTLKTVSTRAVFASQADHYLGMELPRPTLATVQGLALKSSWHSTLGDHATGWAYFGMAERVALSLGLNVDCAPLVQAGKMSMSEMLLRRNTFWTVYIQEQCWSVYIGRPHEVQSFTTPLPEVDDTLDAMPWLWSNLDVPERNLPPQSCVFSSAFLETAKLTMIMQRVMTSLYALKPETTRSHREEKVSELGMAIDTWNEQLPPSLMMSGHSLKNALPHVLVLQLAKEWLTILIFRPYYRNIAMLSGSRHNEGNENISSIAVKRCDRSAARINALLATYHSRFGIRFTPPTVFNMVFTAGTTHLLAAVHHKSNKLKLEARNGAEECVTFLRMIAESWPAAGHKADILEDLVKEYKEPSQKSESPQQSHGESMRDKHEEIMNYIPQETMPPPTQPVRVPGTSQNQPSDWASPPGGSGGFDLERYLRQTQAQPVNDTIPSSFLSGLQTSNSETGPSHSATYGNPPGQLSAQNAWQSLPNPMSQSSISNPPPLSDSIDPYLRALLAYLNLPQPIATTPTANQNSWNETTLQSWSPFPAPLPSQAPQSMPFATPNPAQLPSYLYQQQPSAGQLTDSTSSSQQTGSIDPSGRAMGSDSGMRRSNNDWNGYFGSG